jgi:tRNA-dihydrouridine synthase 3
MTELPALRDRLKGALVMAPMTKGSNLPFRRLCAEYGARVMMSEMAVARRLKQKRASEFALIRRFDGEDCFGVQLAGRKADEMAWAAALVESRGADIIDVNLGCPIDHFTRMGLGAALAREPNRVRKIVEAMKRAVVRVPVTVKIRMGWNDRDLNYMKVAQAALDGGADAIFVHGRTRDARYRLEANWAVIGEVAAAFPVPVIGNGDLLFPHEVTRAFATTACTAVMSARGVLIKPWLFREVTDGYLDMSGEARLAMYRRYVELGLAHWGDDEHGRTRLREFLLWHLGWWRRYVPQRPDGSWPTMQEREASMGARTPLEVLLARGDDPAIEWLADRLMARDEVAPAEAPEPTAGATTPDREAIDVEG